MRKFIISTLLIATLSISIGIPVAGLYLIPEQAHAEASEQDYQTELSRANTVRFALASRLSDLRNAFIFANEHSLSTSLINDVVDSITEIETDLGKASARIEDARVAYENDDIDEAISWLHKITESGIGPFFIFADGSIARAIAATDAVILAGQNAGITDAIDIGSLADKNAIVSESEKNAAAENPQSCLSWKGGLDLNYCIKLGVSTIFYMILTISGIVLGIVGKFLTFATEYTITNIGSNLKKITSIKDAWTIIRDLANLSLIFMLVYIAINTILDTERINIGKSIRQVIIVALLINFSFFFTQIIIDAGNVFALLFYNLASNMSGTTSIADGIMKGLGVSSILDAPEAIQSFASKPWIPIISWGLGGYVLMMVTGFVMIGISFILVARYVIFIFLLITSAAAFAMSILPATSKYSTKWWDTLINQTIVAPVMFLFLWITLQIINESGLAAGQGSTTGALTGSLSVALVSPETGAGLGSLFNFVIAIALLTMSIIAAVALGAGGSKAVAKLGKKLNDKAGYGFAKRTGGASLRGSVGRISLAAESGMSKTRLGNNAIVRSFRNITTGAGAKAKFGTKLDSKKAGEERGRIADLKGAAQVRSIAKKKEGLKNELSNTLAKDHAYQGHTENVKTKKRTLSTKESELAALRTERENETNVVSQIDLERKIETKEKEALDAKNLERSARLDAKKRERAVRQETNYIEKKGNISGPGPRKTKTGIAAGAGTGAILGSPLGPVGAAVGTTAGAVVGGIVGRKVESGKKRPKMGVAAGAVVGAAVAGPVGAAVGAAVAGAAGYTPKARAKVANFFTGSQEVKKSAKEYNKRLQKKIKEGKGVDKAMGELRKEDGEKKSKEKLLADAVKDKTDEEKKKETPKDSDSETKT